MGGMGEKEKYKMYRIVDESECKRYRSDCSHVLKRHVPYLKKNALTPNLLLLAVEQEIWLHETAMDRLTLTTILK